MFDDNPLKFPPEPSPHTILVVDDTRENLCVLGGLLQPYYRVRVANSGLRALAAVASPPRPDLILLDIMMPGMDGYEVLAQLRANRAFDDIPVIFVTALDAAEDESRGLGLGAVDYIAKPIRPAILLARVRCHIELKQARDRMRQQNAWLEAEVARRMQESQLIQDASMRALAGLAETRDSETGNHILRTQVYVELLCQHFWRAGRHLDQLDDGGLERIVKAAPLHDIGKVGVPDHILLKPGALTPEEWVVMRRHTVLGAEALRRAIGSEKDQAAFGFFHVAIQIAQSHHERWDGTGYPDGLSGTAIPFSARLMALADVFDALTSRRIYKPPMSLDAAVGVILEGRGSHFDPEVVGAFLAHLDEFRAIAARHADD
jgi:putative two-component system response regulator